MGNRTDLVAAVARDAGLSKADAARAVDAALAFIGAETAASRPVKLNGFGTFLMRRRPARRGRNPRTGEAIEISASSVLAFRAARGTAR